MISRKPGLLERLLKLLDLSAWRRLHPMKALLGLEGQDLVALLGAW